jgi:ATP-dependent helicase/nuclease subunit A
MRLLYVGMTRASERLVIGGIEPVRGVAENAWHKKVERALVSLGAAAEESQRWGTVTRYSGDVGLRAVRPKRAWTQLDRPTLPDWAQTPAPPEARPPRPLAPSSMAADQEALPPPSAAMRAAAQRGTWIHQLLERLVGVDSERRPHAAHRWLERSAGVADAAQREEIVDQVCGILSDPRFGDLFGGDSLGEAPLAATLPDGRVIAGTVDRLLVEEDRVSVIDFKSGRVPAGPDSIPAAHRAQMTAYTQALEVIFPGRDVRAALLYTSGPELFELGP